jgi:outer membrane protein OmpA-like peptidoglycan-associated protein
MSLHRILRSRICIAIISLCAVIAAGNLTAYAQSDLDRETVAITYPLDSTINVRFRGTTRLPRLKGEAKVRRTGRRGTRVELGVENLPRPSELGGPYTTYILWAVTPEGRVDSLGEIKRNGSFIFDSKVDVTTPLQTFALIVTAEPHFLVRTPSRMVVLENLPPREPNGAEVATVAVQYIGNTSDYFNQARVPEIADQTYTRTPVSLLGARQAVALARYAGATRDASEELRAAETQLEAAENAWRLNSKEAEVDQLARNATSLAARAEEVAEARKGARARREEIALRDKAVRDAERTNDEASEEITTLKNTLTREQRERELVERDLANATQQLRDARSEVARLRDELQTAESAASEARIKLARMEGERSAEDARLREEETRRREQQRQADIQAAMNTLRQTLGRAGTVRESAGNFVVVLPESLWANTRAAQLAPAARTTLNPLINLLANSPGWQVTIETHTDGTGTEDALRQLTQQRADLLSERFVAAGMDGARVQANGLGATRPLAAGTTPAARARNRRTEITLIPTPAPAPNTAAAPDETSDGNPR